MTILYITQNGVTDHIGRSQVAPYVAGLARRGFKIHVLSAEKADRDALIDEYQQLFDHVDVRWTRVPYCNKPRLVGQVLTHFAMQRAARGIVQEESIRLVHCRSFLPAAIGQGLKRKFGVKYIFDFRDFYADGGIHKTRGLTRLAYRRLKQMEGPMVREADKVICLTNRARQVLDDWYLRDAGHAERCFQVIPCCTDFNLFDPARVSASDIADARKRANLGPDDFVLLYLGSLGPDYLLSDMIALFRQVLIIRPNARFLFVINNGEELVKTQCYSQRVPIERITFVSADRKDVAAFISLADISVVFIRADFSKVGCSPTKLGELFACNVPVIANSGVGDLDTIIRFEKNGSVIVKDFADETLRAAIERIMELKKNGPISIRENSREFALEEGVRRYDEVYSELLA